MYRHSLDGVPFCVDAMLLWLQKGDDDGSKMNVGTVGGVFCSPLTGRRGGTGHLILTNPIINVSQHRRASMKGL